MRPHRLFDWVDARVTISIANASNRISNRVKNVRYVSRRFVGSSSHHHPRAFEFCYQMCGTFYGIAMGTQPEGRMTVSRNSSHLSGHSGCGQIVMQFEFPGGTQGKEHPNPGKAYHGDSRVAYLPDNAEGQKLLKMFEVGWERKQLFKIGFSETRNVDGVICYNGIHMKSAPSGTHGYPDPTYPQRVKEEFGTKGIYEDSQLAAAAKK